MKRLKGFSLIEILIAVGFFAVGFGALWFMFGSTNKQVFMAQGDLNAYNIARERLAWMSEAEFEQVVDSHDLLKQSVIEDKYIYFDLQGKKKEYVYPEDYKRFEIISTVEEIDENFKRVVITVSYKIKSVQMSREVSLERIVSNE